MSNTVAVCWSHLDQLVCRSSIILLLIKSLFNQFVGLPAPIFRPLLCFYSNVDCTLNRWILKLQENKKMTIKNTTLLFECLYELSFSSCIDCILCRSTIHTLKSIQRNRQRQKSKPFNWYWLMKHHIPEIWNNQAKRELHKSHEQRKTEEETQIGNYENTCLNWTGNYIVQIEINTKRALYRRAAAVERRQGDAKKRPVKE